MKQTLFRVLCMGFLYFMQSNYRKNLNKIEGTIVKESKYKSYDELPLFLNAKTVSELLRISQSMCYGLMRKKIFLRSELAQDWLFNGKNSANGLTIGTGHIRNQSFIRQLKTDMKI